MTSILILGDPAYSSWSLRGWLLFHAFGLPVQTRFVDFSQPDTPAQIDAPPAVTVPTWRPGDGAVIHDSLAIAEELATRHPDAGHWPSNPVARATARTLAAEMHSGFTALRGACPMNLRVAYADSAPSGAVLADLSRLDTIWSHALDASGGPWLCGAYSAADAFYAPAAARIAGYALPVSPAAAAYVAAHIAHPPFRDWFDRAQTDGPDLPRYARDYPQAPWPH